MCPGCSAAHSGALLFRDRYTLGVRDDPGSAAHHFVLRRARETLLLAAALSLSCLRESWPRS